jgi:hypothetical protein
MIASSSFRRLHADQAGCRTVGFEILINIRRDALRGNVPGTQVNAHLVVNVLTESAAAYLLLLLEEVEDILANITDQILSQVYYECGTYVLHCLVLHLFSI